MNKSIYKLLELMKKKNKPNENVEVSPYELDLTMEALKAIQKKYSPTPKDLGREEKKEKFEEELEKGLRFKKLRKRLL